MYDFLSSLSENTKVFSNPDMLNHSRMPVNNQTDTTTAEKTVILKALLKSNVKNLSEMLIGNTGPWQKWFKLKQLLTESQGENTQLFQQVRS